MLLCLICVVVFINLVSCSTPNVPKAEINALWSLYNSTNGANWNWSTNSTALIWNFNTAVVNPCTPVWQGLTCTSCTTSSDCHILIIELAQYSLEGTLPDLSNLKFLKKLDLGSNSISGTLPTTLFEFPSLDTLYLSENQMTGTVPSTLSLLSTLFFAHLQHNLFTGFIPSELSVLSNLKVLYLDVNSLSGSFPAEFSNLHSLYSFSISINSVTNSIPNSLGVLTNLVEFVTASNYMSGTIPTTFFNLTAMELISIDNNFLSGTMPSDWINMPYLEGFYVESNFLTGTLPNFLNLLPSLELFYMNNNFFTGSIPSSFGYIQKLQLIHLDYNSLTGSIPNTLMNLSLKVLYLDYNLLTGTIPRNISQLTLLQALYLGDNDIEGNIPLLPNSLVALYLHSSNYEGNLNSLVPLPNLEYFDLSNNQLTGSIPCALFESSVLQSALFSTNCFDGTLPNCPCNASGLHFLDFGNLASASSCSIRMFYNPDIKINNRVLQGSLPECLFSMPNLRSLVVDGNGIDSPLPDISADALLYVSLSYNHFRNVIPNSWKSHAFIHLDLSSNHLRGGVTGIDLNFTGAVANVSIELDVNRLSGNIPTFFSDHTFKSMNILSGNMFSCNNLHSHIPAQDPNSATYTCGSQELDISWFILLAQIMVCVIALGVVVYVVIEGEGFKKVATSSNEVAARVQLELQSFRENVLWVTVLLIVFHLPLYCSLKTAYSTHDSEYGWFPSLAFLDGLVSLGFTVVAYVILWVVLLYRARVMYFALEVTRPVTAKKSFAPAWKSCCFFVLCVLVSGAANGAYVYVILSQSLVIQRFVYIAFVLFKLFWNSQSLSLLAESDWLWRLAVLMFNTILMPALASVVVDTTCYYNMIVAPDPVSVYYLKTDCLQIVTLTGVGILVKTICAGDVPYELRFIPTFSYSYQCGSAILTNYVPVLIAMFGLSGVFTPLLRICLQYYEQRSTESRLSCCDDSQRSTFAYYFYFFKQKEKFSYNLENRSLRLAVALISLSIYGFGYPLLSLVVLLYVVILTYESEWNLSQDVMKITKDVNFDLKSWENSLINESANMRKILFSSIKYYLFPSGIFLFFILVDEEGGVSGAIVMIVLLFLAQIGVIRRARKLEQQVMIELSSIKATIVQSEVDNPIIPKLDNSMDACKNCVADSEVDK